MIKVLHLFSNAKWTGPAEPALNLCVALRRAGVHADFACCPDAGNSINKVVETARDRGIEPILRFRLAKHLNPIANFFDRLALKPYMQSHGYQLVHCHMDNDNRIAAPAACSLGIPLVRSSYHGAGFPAKAGFTRMLRGVARLIEPSRVAMEHDAEAHGYPREQMAVIPGAVDVDRFDPTREVPDGRRWLGIPPDAFVVGIVARMQTHRRYEDFFEAIRMLVDKRPNTHVIVVGRGTRQESVGKQPVRDHGLTEHVHFPGYLDGENYVGMLRAFDVKVFLVPGSDGTCRAVREVMAMSKPVVVADRGMLPEIVSDGTDGYVFDNSAKGLFTALDRLAGDRRLARSMGHAARETAVKRYSLEAQSAAVLGIYEELLAAHRRG